ncbi:GtrA family protein [Methylocystis iwaonis]|nr:GtrA family protein [Methylocystis iwaonis]
MFARFAIVGVTCALLNNALLIYFVMLGLMPIGAALATVPPSLMIGYALQAGFVFRERPTWAAFLRYCIAMLSNQPRPNLCVLSHPQATNLHRGAGHDGNAVTLESDSDPMGDRIRR